MDAERRRQKDTKSVSELKSEIERLKVTREKTDTAKERDGAHVKLQRLFDELKQLER